MFSHIFIRGRALFIALMLIAASALPALAGPFEDAVALFANDDFSDTQDAVGVIATSGNPQALAAASMASWWAWVEPSSATTTSNALSS